MASNVHVRPVEQSSKYCERTNPTLVNIFVTVRWSALTEEALVSYNDRLAVSKTGLQIRASDTLFINGLFFS